MYKHCITIIWGRICHSMSGSEERESFYLLFLQRLLFCLPAKALDGNVFVILEHQARRETNAKVTRLIEKNQRTNDTGRRGSNMDGFECGR